MTTSAEVLETLGLRKGSATASNIRLAARIADDQGICQRGDVQRAFPGLAPEFHTTTTLTTLLLVLGCQSGGE
jgi:hypothetical protein